MARGKKNLKTKRIKRVRRKIRNAEKFEDEKNYEKDRDATCEEDNVQR